MNEKKSKSIFFIIYFNYRYPNHCSHRHSQNQDPMVNALYGLLLPPWLLLLLRHPRCNWGVARGWLWYWLHHLESALHSLQHSQYGAAHPWRCVPGHHRHKSRATPIYFHPDSWTSCLYVGRISTQVLAYASRQSHFWPWRRINECGIIIHCFRVV